MRNPANYVNQRIRIVGTYCGEPYRHDGTLLEILPPTRKAGVALVLLLDKPQCRTVRIETRRFPSFVNKEFPERTANSYSNPSYAEQFRFLEALHKRGIDASLNYYGGDPKTYTVYHKGLIAVQVIVPLLSIQHLHPLTDDFQEVHE